MQAVIYGIKNCDTMKKAFGWLAEHRVAYRFHDYRKDGLDADTLRGWCGSVGWKALVNTRGTTWRKLSPEQQAIAGEDAAIALMLENPSLIRRPVLAATGKELLIGFEPERYAATLDADGGSKS
ncbi:ArsC family reductase [Azoarcus sp. DD4]|uniref:ArsC family reductase n=1 Tax=Azoarcus sp. DD4 TaxID=2027405 RepID=UPI00112818B8|nr:ArsC family reductase [Azoarcus sp. DD4]QDF97134.1 ArsC family reductase [Azoarcus sp. DD4]